MLVQFSAPKWKPSCSCIHKSSVAVQRSLHRVPKLNRSYHCYCYVKLTLTVTLTPAGHSASTVEEESLSSSLISRRRRWLMHNLHMTDKETHRGCAGTRREGRWGRASTHTGHGQSHTRCLSAERWLLQRWREQRGRKRRRRRAWSREKSQSFQIEKDAFIHTARHDVTPPIQQLSSLYYSSLIPLLILRLFRFHVKLFALTCRRDGDGGGFDVSRQSRRGRVSRRGGFYRNTTRIQVSMEQYSDIRGHINHQVFV